MIGEPDHETDSQLSKHCKGFANNLSANMKLSKTHLSKKVESGEFLIRFLGPLLKSSLPPLMKNILKLLAKMF